MNGTIYKSLILCLSRLIACAHPQLVLVHLRHGPGRGVELCAHSLSVFLAVHLRGKIRQIVIRTLSGFRYLCQQLAYLVHSRIFLIASQIDESLGSYQDYSAKLVGKQGGEFMIAALVKS
jgi:hypothetical protein